MLTNVNELDERMMMREVVGSVLEVKGWGDLFSELDWLHVKEI